MVAGFNDSCRQIKMSDVLCCGRVAKENPRKIVVVKFASSDAQLLYTDMGSKSLEVFDVRFATMPSFVRCFVDSGTDKTVV